MPNQPNAAPPVFVDRTGRRRRLTVIAGVAMGLGLLTSFGLILAGLFFDSTVPLPGWSDTKPPPIEAGVDAPPRDREPTAPSPRPSSATRTGPSASAPSATHTTVPTRAATTAAPRPTASVPGQGDERRNSARPSRSPGKP
ncbi:hypothetical protein GCE86_27055 [Micromonospora terminaliae]|uniref:Uncharacterized protein n=1 Tax=Micromonospora terminaliae TaxID=1914461 RepID=A0AAJ2ZBV1_9ACTN|nr:hypothetical protein [Micromonospora terminaliae]NES26159.1 hypothetical protein [Micromonospora terminaliae]QGL50354.1 hypothetical protein GCE86_27055 [Micromonospora terminaliae]